MKIKVTESGREDGNHVTASAKLVTNHRRCFILSSTCCSQDHQGSFLVQYTFASMATDPSLQDPLLALRRAIAAGSLPTATTSSDLSTENSTDDLAKATHLYFQNPLPQSLALSSPTRFISSSSDSPVDLRGIFFAYQKKDVAIPEYIASVQELNEALKHKERAEGAPEEQAQNLTFVERLDLITWLEGASDDSEYIKPLEGVAGLPSGSQAQASAGAPGTAGASAPSAPAAGAGRPGKTIDPRLQEIYNGERKLGDRNSVLRGIKHTVRSPPHYSIGY